MNISDYHIKTEKRSKKGVALEDDSVLKEMKIILVAREVDEDNEGDLVATNEENSSASTDSDLCSSQQLVSPCTI